MAQNHANRSKGNRNNKRHQQFRSRSGSTPCNTNNSFGSNESLTDYECPVCVEIMLPPIYICESGHSICSSCRDKIDTRDCPFCRKPITDMRNYSLEAIIQRSSLPCPRRSDGCKYTGDLSRHLKECIYRVTDCIFGSTFGNCAWNGPLQTMLEHCKECHKQYADKVKVNSDIVLDDFDPDDDQQILQLVEVGSQLCYYHFKVDTSAGNAYWAIQFVGTTNFVKSWFYEIHIFNKSKPERIVTFVDMCKPDSALTEEIFESGECAILPLKSLEKFIDARRRLVLKIYIKRFQRGMNLRNASQQNE